MPDLSPYVGDLGPVLRALVSLPVAAVLGSILAFRPRRRGTPPLNPSVIHAQIILAVVGALVMLVIGESLARAFGIVGAAGLVRYRARIRSAKDAGVMLSTLGVGLASGVGLYALAAFATAFVFLLLWLVESRMPTVYKRYALRLSAGDAAALRGGVEKVLRRRSVRLDLKSCSNDELDYEIRVPLESRDDSLESEIRSLAEAESATVEWKRKKSKQFGG